MEIKKVGTQPSAKGLEGYFTGTVRIDPLFIAPEPARATGGGGGGGGLGRDLRTRGAYSMAYPPARPDTGGDIRLWLGTNVRAARSKRSTQAMLSGFRRSKSTGMGRRPLRP